MASNEVVSHVLYYQRIYWTHFISRVILKTSCWPSAIIRTKFSG